jgi:hypothetical protein
MSEYALTNEFLLAAACAVWPPSPSRHKAIEGAASMSIDWSQFLHVAHRHRVVGLVRDGLKRANVAVPPAAWESISAAAADQLRQNLLFAAELVRLSRAFRERGVPVAIVKGIPTALDVYGNLQLRHLGDIDLLVAPGAIFTADTIVTDEGYERVRPPPGIDMARINLLTSIAKDFVYLKRESSSLVVELHWRLFENSQFMSGLSEAAVPRLYPELDNLQIRTLAGDDQFAYLCAHGAAFAWTRLKWLADVAALLAAELPDGAGRLYEAALARGAARPAGQALLLCQRLLGSLIPEELVRRLRTDRAVLRLEDLAMTALTQNGADAEPYEIPSALSPMSKSLWLLNGSPRFLMGKIKTHLIGWDDVVSVPLPRRWQFLYPLLRVPLWLWRRASS